jgi:hypothetical protein
MKESIVISSLSVCLNVAMQRKHNGHEVGYYAGRHVMKISYHVGRHTTSTYNKLVEHIYKQ